MSASLQKPVGGLAPWPPAGPPALHPAPFSLLRQRKGGKRKAAPHCARPSPAARGSLRCSKTGPGQNSRRSLRSLCSNRLAESEGMRACGTRAGLLRCSAAQRGWETEQPNPQQPAIRSLPAVSGSRFGCWLLAVARRLRRRGAQTRGPCAAGAHRDLTRAACLSRRSRSDWRRVLRVAPLSSTTGNPLGRRPSGRAQQARLSFPPFSLAEQRKGGRVQGRRSCSGSRGEAPWSGVQGRKAPGRNVA